MATLLHLSDLHLTGLNNPVSVADHKVQVVPINVAGTRKKLLMSSLYGLGESLRENGEVLDAIVITGDITTAGADEGYDELTEVLASLETSLPEKDRILIVPGNHDVDRDARGDQRFDGIRKLRAEGYKVGWLSESEVTTEPPPVLRSTDDSFVLVGLNSSMFAGSMLNVESGLEAHLAQLERLSATDPAIGALLAAWKNRGRADIARMSDVELAAARTHLGTATTRSPLRIVGLHHQVLPIGTAEEIKPFEGILNLGQFRRWLASNQIDLVLHGHKHNGAAIRDRIDNGTGGAHEVTILSAPSVATATGADEPIGQLIRVPTDLPRISEYEVITVPAAESGAPKPLSAMDRRLRPLDELMASGTIVGNTVDLTYARICAALHRLQELPTPIVCRIENGATGLKLPDAMPDIPPAGQQRDIWLDSVIDWWQRERPGRAASFNHGEFLQTRRNDRVSAVEKIAEQLLAKPGSSKALAVLVSQETIFGARDFPSFISLQFVLKQHSRLDAIAYFRKQEMRHWWPINVVEVARIQTQVLSKIRGNFPVICGSITTITAMPVPGEGMPTVSVPDLDRRVDRPGGMLDLVLPLFSSLVSQDEVEFRWKRVFADWAPSEKEPPDGDPRPRLGLLELAETVQSAANTYANTPVIEDLISRVNDLHAANELYAEGRREAWASQVTKSEANVMRALMAVLSERDAAEEPVGLP